MIRASLAARVIAGLLVAAAGAAPAAADDGAGEAADRAAPAPADRRALFGFGEPAAPADEPAVCDGGGGWPCVVRDGAPGWIGERLDRRRRAALGGADVGAHVVAAQAVGGWIERDGVIAFPGAGGLEARWLVDGLPADGVADGGRALIVPLPFVEAVDVVTGGMPAGTTSSTGAVVDVRLRRGGATHEVEAAAWTRLGFAPRRAAPVPDRYEPIVLEDEAVRGVSAAVVAGGPVPAPGPVRDAWYLVGIAPAGLDEPLTRRARRLRDADGDGRYDRHPDRTLALDEIDARDVERSSLTVPWIARLGGRAGRHEVALTAVGHGRRRIRPSGVGTPSATTVDDDALAALAAAAWTARWPRTELAVAAAWLRDARWIRPHDRAAADAVQLGTAYVPAPDAVPEDAAFAAACADGGPDDPYPQVFNCPVPTGFYLRGGAGALVDAVADRPVVTAALVHRAGAHRVSAGVTGEDARWIVRRRLSGGHLERRLDEEVILTLHLVERGAGPGFDATCAGEPCRLLDVDEQVFRTRHVAGWLEDAWQPAPGLTVAAGARWTSAEVGSRLGFRDQVAPRLAVGLDPTRRGRARVHASWGRYHAILPADLGRALYQTSDVLARVTFPGMGDGEQLVPGGRIAAAADLSAPTVEELAAGAEWVIGDAIHVGALARHRRLWGGLEDVGARLVTPGRGDAAGRVPLRRDSVDLQASLANAPDARVHVRLAYLHARQRGTWPGPHDPLEGATLYRSSWDGSTTNLAGRLPFDLPHRFLAELITGGRAAGLDLTVGARFEVASGRPVGVRAGAGGEVLLLPRGEAGRMPATSTAVVHVAARRGAVTVALDLIDAFGRRAPAAVDERWTTAEVRPIEGGDAADLLWLRDTDDRRATPNPGHGRATAFHAPRLVRLSVSAAF